jgi:hypothetical protein
MLIRSTPNACFVFLRNGLTLELSYDQHLTVPDPRSTGIERRRGLVGSHGVWILKEEVLLEVKVGQA